MQRMFPKRMVRRSLMALALLVCFETGFARELTLAVHPVLPSQRTHEVYQPLVEYLSAAIGQPVKLFTATNFLAHWQLTKRGEFDLILDGPHFTDYRIQKMGYTVLAKLPSVVSYSLVAHEDNLVLEPSELIGRKIASTPSPALGALRLEEFFPNPLRQPLFLETDDSETAIAQVLDKQAAAAIVPTPLLERYPQLTVIASTEQVPAPGLSAAKSLDPALRDQIRHALLEASGSAAGRAALEALHIHAFEPATAKLFRGHGRSLESMWGY